MIRRPLAIALTAGLTLTMGVAGTGASAMPAPHDAAPHALAAGPVLDTADDLPAGAIAADGVILQLERDGDTLYATGDFDQVGHYTGPGAVLSASTGETAPSATIGDGQVSVAVTDGAGGWYLGGDFTRIGGHPAGGIAHVLADGDVDVDFQPVVNGLVSAVALEGDTLWFGGKFTQVDGTSRHNLAAVSVSSGALLPFDAPQAKRVTELAYAPLDGVRTARLFVGSNHLAAVDPVTGLAVPGFSADAHGVHALLVSGDTLYVGDAGLRAVDVGTGAAVAGFTSALPEGTGYRAVHSLLASGSTLYVGTDIPGARLAALDAATGARESSFAPTVGQGGVYDLALDGDRLWAGGGFSGGLTVVNASTGSSLDVALPSYDRDVNAVELSGGQAYVGGKFWNTDGSDTRGIAAFDATTLAPLPDFHAKASPYGDLMFTPDVVYVADNHFRGYETRYPVADGDFFYPYTSRIDTFDPATGASLGPIRVKRMAGATTIGDRLYVAQRVEDDLRFPHNNILVFNAAGKQVDSFRVPLLGYVTTMATVDGELLLGGSFKRTAQGIYPANTAMLRLDPANGHRRAYFNPRIHGPVYDLDVEGKDIYAAGLFTQVNQRTGGARAGVVGLTARSRLTSFVPEGTHPGIYTRLQEAGGVVWTGGARFLDATTGAATPDPTGWTDSERSLWGLTSAPDGVAYSSYLSMNLTGTDYFQLGFVSTTGD